ncbi:MAG: glycosyltransferase family 1 protein, partial [Hungatella sp.]|nr:glycosyltransferase family 1 protein [Hungatella sp.]
NFYVFSLNHNFLIDVFSKLHKKYSDTVLVLIGTGEYETVIKEKVKTLNLWKSVIFLGHRDDVPQLLSAMDCLVMPSRFEGLPVTMVEAQMADLPCVVSGTITREAEFTSHVTYISSWNKEEWVEKIYKYKKAERLKNKEEKQESIFNIKNAVKKLTEILD